MTPLHSFPLPPPAVVGQPLASVDTPALLLDLDAFERNLDRMQAAADVAGIALRPHGKAHKTPAIAHAQIARGAVGICCQKVSEAIAFAAAGIGDIHISNELASAFKAALAADLAGRVRLSVCVDDSAQVAAIGKAASRAGTTVGLLVDIDIGQGRCGVADADAVRRLLDAAAHHPGLDFRGLQAYQGSVQHIRGHAARQEEAQRAADRAGTIRRALEQAGIRCATVTGGGSGSAEFDLQSGVYTELQVGSYACMDRDYADNESGATLPFEHALFLAATVMSTASGRHAVVDAGLKSLAVDSGLPTVWPQDAGLVYRQASDEHGIVEPAAGAASVPALGTLLRLVPGHCDPTFNLHDTLVCFRGDTVADLWPIAARGMSR
ncbi:DSD1 family PLP-dependent enzyme [uncultured Xylophilus sp.]|uniref:DSD1 family PLP-dependent enzyme n=1 Tax=uncultured Xylophilus sp. TaxID=296832 RepID=UPI0025D618CA|nr:DSD1 family PLP-dependent enzyme [uncultured Xylophilus sp.]